MSNKKILTFRIMSFLTLGLIFLTSLGFLIEILRIYTAGNYPMYTKDIVGKYLIELLPLIIVTTIMIIVLGVYTVLNISANKKGVALSYEQRFKFYKNQDQALLSNELYIKEIKKRKIIYAIKYVLLSLCLLIPTIYVFRTFNPEKDVTNQMINSVIFFVPWVVIGAVVLYVANIYVEKSYSNSLKILFENRNELHFLRKENLIKLWIVRGVIFTIALTLIIVGIARGEHLDVLKKAVNICSECIGIG